MQATGDQQALHDADLLGAEFATAKAAHRDGARGALQLIGVDRHVQMRGKSFQPGTPRSLLMAATFYPGSASACKQLPVRLYSGCTQGALALPSAPGRVFRSNGRSEERSMGICK